MTIQEIISRLDTSPLTEEECYFVLSEYIRIRKGKVVHPVINAQYGEIHAFTEMQKMHEMLNVAITWFRENEKSTYKFIETA